MGAKESDNQHRLARANMSVLNSKHLLRNYDHVNGATESGSIEVEEIIVKSIVNFLHILHFGTIEKQEVQPASGCILRYGARRAARKEHQRLRKTNRTPPELFQKRRIDRCSPPHCRWLNLHKHYLRSKKQTMFSSPVDLFMPNAITMWRASLHSLHSTSASLHLQSVSCSVFFF